MRQLATVPALPAPRSVDEMIAERDELIRLQTELPERIRAVQTKINRRAASPLPRLSVRQREVLDGIMQEKANKTIAYDLHIAERTVKFHVSRLLSKFKVKNRQELILCNHV